MKANLFKSEKSFEIRLSNATSFFSTEGESIKDFIARITETVERDYMEELEYTLIDRAKLGRNSSKMLRTKLEKSTGTEKELVTEILISRGEIEEAPAPGGSIYNGTDGEEDLDVPKEDEPTSDEPTSDEPKPDKPKKSPKVTDEESLAAVEKSKENIGRQVEFLCSKTKAMESGIIKRIRRDPRSNMVVYMIQTEIDGVSKMFGKTVWAKPEELILGELANDEVTPTTEEK